MRTRGGPPRRPARLNLVERRREGLSAGITQASQRLQEPRAIAQCWKPKATSTAPARRVQAIEAGASLLVVGRPLRDAPDPDRRR